MFVKQNSLGARGVFGMNSGAVQQGYPYKPVEFQKTQTINNPNNFYNLNNNIKKDF